VEEGEGVLQLVVQRQAAAATALEEERDDLTSRLEEVRTRYSDASNIVKAVAAVSVEQKGQIARLTGQVTSLTDQLERKNLQVAGIPRRLAKVEQEKMRFEVLLRREEMVRPFLPPSSRTP
jgi:septal ring factor EnvC (AmiA/AmiB activator)